MKQELMDKEVLAMYDVRGIQNYIFRNNDLKEVIGASELVENIIIDGMKEVIEKKVKEDRDNFLENQEQEMPNIKWEKEKFLLDWEQKEGCEFFENPEILMQVMFIGGGNAYVLFRKGIICRQMNRKLAKYVLDHTYSLNLAVAVVEKTDSYKIDYEKINQEMRNIKARMPETKPVGAMPFMAIDTIMGYPLTHFKKFGDGEERYFCTESFLKRTKYIEESQKAGKKDSSENIIDNMVTEKGDSSTVAIIHIDGNNMGKRIKKIMEKKEDYIEAIHTMRAISKNIKDSFTASFNITAEYIKNISDQVKKNREGELYRKIILAGDDITFICNAKVAIGAVETFLRDISSKLLYYDENKCEQENKLNYSFSACAGIAYFYSHFPFRDAYQVAEACCDSAKARAKQKEQRNKGKEDGNIGNFFDYQICTHIKAANLKEYREKNYKALAPGEEMIARPYYVSCKTLDDLGVDVDLNKRNEKYSSDILDRSIKFFQSDKNIARNKAKKLCHCYAFGIEEVKKYIEFLKSREIELPEEKEVWYDALELMDICVKEE